MVLDFDLNHPHSAVGDTDDLVNENSSIRPPESSQTSRMQTAALDPDDDEVVTCSPKSFYEAKEKARARRNSRAAAVNDSERVIQRGSSDSVSRSSSEGKKRCQWASPELTIPNNVCCINLEDSDDEDKDKSGAKGSGISPSAPPPEELTITCPVCWEPFVEATTTKCGHIFCKECISKAIASQKQCPTCRKKLRANSILRIHLPAP